MAATQPSPITAFNGIRKKFSPVRLLKPPLLTEK
jgi:hypothetical protein